MKLKDLIERLQAIQKEIGDGPPHEGIKGDVEVWLNYTGPAHLDLTTQDLKGTIIGVEPIPAAGCGCWLDAAICIMVKPED